MKRVTMIDLIAIFLGCALFVYLNFAHAQVGRQVTATVTSVAPIHESIQVSGGCNPVPYTARPAGATYAGGNTGLSGSYGSPAVTSNTTAGQTLGGILGGMAAGNSSNPQAVGLGTVVGSIAGGMAQRAMLPQQQQPAYQDPTYVPQRTCTPQYESRIVGYTYTAETRDGGSPVVFSGRTQRNLQVGQQIRATLNLTATATE